jgi:anti-sigma factor RsiW
MSCEKYSGWLTDAALGELRAEREPELLAHAMECDACREALAHARDVRELVDRGAEALVAGEPSPQFTANLRRRIAQESEPLRSPWMAWAPVIASALALTMVLAFIVARIPRHSVANPSSATNLESGPAPSEAVNASTVNPQNVEQPARTRDSNRSATARTAKVALPEIIVPKGQLSAVAQLSAAINSGRVDGNQLVAAQQEYEKPLDVRPIEIAPLEIPPLGDAMEKPTGSIQF